MKPNVVIDFETYYDEECSIKTLGPLAYVEHPSFDAYLVSVYDGENEFVGHPKDFDFGSISGCQWWAHNAQFDWTVYEWCVRRGYVDHYAPQPWLCSASLSAFMGAPRSLDKAAKTLLGIEVDKGMRSWMKGKRWEDAVAAGKAQALADYAMKDAKVAWHIVEKYQSKWPDFERKLAVHTVTSGMTGVAVDSRYIVKCQDELLSLISKTEKKLPWMSAGGKAKPTSTKSLAEECRKVGIPVPKSTAADSEECAAWLRQHGEKYPWVKAMQDHRAANRALKLLQTVSNRVVNGRFTYQVKYFGAHTGRWSGDGGFNMHNLPREPLGNVDIRRCFIPSRGKKFVVADLAQIEARVLLWLVNDRRQLELIKTGVSVYEAHARQTMKWTGGELKKEDPKLYALAKARVLGLGYGCGANKFVDVARAMAGLNITPAESNLTVASFRASNLGIVKLWGQLDRDAQRSVGGTYEIELPSGRVLEYYGVMRKGGQLVAQQWRGEMHKAIYGGLLCENLVQATARDVLGDIILRLEGLGYPVVFNVHDEVVVETTAGAVDDVKYIMEEDIPWISGLPIGVEAKETERYLK